MFSNVKLNTLIKTLVMKGITIELIKAEDRNIDNRFIAINLNTQAKSDAILVLEDEKTATIHKRYNETVTLNLDQDDKDILLDICFIVRDCMFGRDYVGNDWNELFIELDIIG